MNIVSWLLVVWSLIKPFVTGVIKKELQLVLPIVEKFVHQVNAGELEGTDKRKLVFEATLKELADSQKSVKDFIINLCIELVVAKLKTSV